MDFFQNTNSKFSPAEPTLNVVNGNVSPLSSKGYHSDETPSLASWNYNYYFEEQEEAEELCQIFPNDPRRASHRAKIQFDLETILIRDANLIEKRNNQSYCDSGFFDRYVANNNQASSVKLLLDSEIKQPIGVHGKSIPLQLNFNEVGLKCDPKNYNLYNRPRPLFSANRDLFGNNDDKVGICLSPNPTTMISEYASTSSEQSKSSRQKPKVAQDDMRSQSNSPVWIKMEDQRSQGKHINGQNLSLVPNSVIDVSPSHLVRKTRSCYGETTKLIPTKFQTSLTNSKPHVIDQNGTTRLMRVSSADMERIKLFYGTSKSLSNNIRYISPDIIDFYVPKKSDSNSIVDQKSIVTISTKASRPKFRNSSADRNSVYDRTNQREASGDLSKGLSSNFALKDPTSRDMCSEPGSLNDALDGNEPCFSFQDTKWVRSFSGIAFILETLSDQKTLINHNINLTSLMTIPKWMTHLIVDAKDQKSHIVSNNSNNKTFELPLSTSNNFNSSSNKLSLVIAEPGTGFLLWKADLVDYGLPIGGKGFEKNCKISREGPYMNSLKTSFINRIFNKSKYKTNRKTCKIDAISEIVDYRVISSDQFKGTHNPQQISGNIHVISKVEFKSPKDIALAFKNSKDSQEFEEILSERLSAQLSNFKLPLDKCDNIWKSSDAIKTNNKSISSTAKQIWHYFVRHDLHSSSFNRNSQNGRSFVVKKRLLNYSRKPKSPWLESCNKGTSNNLRPALSLQNIRDYNNPEYRKLTIKASTLLNGNLKSCLNKSMISQPCRFQHLTAIKRSDRDRFYSIKNLVMEN